MEHLAPLQAQSRLSAVLVTTPQLVALTDAMKCLSFTRVVALPVLGLIENMSGYACRCCGEVTNVFSTGGGEAMAEREGIPFLGSLPVDTQLAALLDDGGQGGDEGKVEEVNGITEQGDSAVEKTGFTVLDGYRRTPTHKLFSSMVEKVTGSLATSPASS
jgi:NUBPL iron-transfer P-loop NTPase